MLRLEEITSSNIIASSPLKTSLIIQEFEVFFLLQKAKKTHWNNCFKLIKSFHRIATEAYMTIDGNSLFKAGKEPL